jgi:hypothetical protein
MSHMPALDDPAVGTAVSSNRQILTTGGLTGGGDLSADRTLSIDTSGVTTAKIADSNVTTVKIADANVTLAKLADVATARILGRVTAGTGVPEAMTGTQATTLLDAFTSGLKGLAPASGGGTTNFLRADGTWTAVVSGTQEAIDVTDSPYNAVGDGTTDDRAAVQAAADAAKAAGKNLLFPDGTFFLDGYIDFNGHIGTRIYGLPGAVVKFSSDDTGITSDAIATSNWKARSAFFLRYCSNVRFENLRFRGGDSQDFGTVNIGFAVFAEHTVGTRITRCEINGGYSLFGQEVYAATTSEGDSLAVTAGVVTLTDAAALFSPGHVGRVLTIVDATDQRNNGAFIVTEYVSTSAVKFLNAGGVAETSSFRWSIDDNDRDAVISECRIENVRGSLWPTNDTKILACAFEKPSTLLDTCGIGDSFAFAGVTVTLTDRSARFLPSMDGRIVVIDGATSPANEGTFKLTYISSTQISWTNASGVAEDFEGTWWVANGEKVGFGAGATAIAMSGSTATLTSAENSFAASDVGKVVRIAYSASGNEGAFVIDSYVSPTQITYTDASGVNENFAGIWAIDSWLRANLLSGSTHAIYSFAGRNNVLVDGCSFRGIRATCVKASGSSAPIRGIVVSNCTAVDCGDFFVGGADDAQEHTNFIIDNNTLVDVATGSSGNGNYVAIQILGSKSVAVTNNKFHYTRNTIGAVDGLGIAGNFGIQVSFGAQPIEDALIEGNTFTIDPSNCTHQKVLQTAIDCNRVGIMSKYNTASGTLTKVGSVMTLTDANNKFTYHDVGKDVRFVNSTSAGNNGFFVVTAVPSSTSFEFVNAGGVAEAIVGTYGLYGSWGDGGGLRIAGNRILSAAQTCISTDTCVAPEIVGNIIANGAIWSEGDALPRIIDNREVASNTQSPRIHLFNGTSWPIVHGNIGANSLFGEAMAPELGIGTGGSNHVDYPLLGSRGRALPSDGQPEVVVAYGTEHVDGDRFIIGASTFTYKATAPGAGQFNSYASLETLINAIGGGTYVCADLGAASVYNLADPIDHFRIRLAVASTSVDLFNVQVDTLNPTALVVLRNNAAKDRCNSRGEESGAGTSDKTIVWSPCCSRVGAVLLQADNTAARTLLQAGGYYTPKGTNDGGCNDVVSHSDSIPAGGQQFRWSLR